MTEPTPGTPAPGTGDPGAAGQSLATPPPPSQPVDWEGRYKGQVQANSKQALEIQGLNTQLAEKEQQITQIMGEKDTLKVTWETKLKDSGEAFLKLKQESDADSQQHAVTTAELAKFRTLSQHPELMMYADLIQPTMDQAELEAQLAKVQQIHAQSLEAARKGLQQQGFAPPAAPPSTPPGAVTEASLEKALKKAETDHAMGRITRDQFLEMSAEIGAQYNLLLQQGGRGGQ